jgi:hypothetical protein
MEDEPKPFRDPRPTQLISESQIPESLKPRSVEKSQFTQAELYFTKINLFDNFVKSLSVLNNPFHTRQDDKRQLLIDEQIPQYEGTYITTNRDRMSVTLKDEKNIPVVIMRELQARGAQFFNELPTDAQQRISRNPKRVTRIS